MAGDAPFVLIAALSLVLWIWVIVDVSGRAELSGERKALWIVAALLFPVGATLVYLFAGRKRPRL